MLLTKLKGVECYEIRSRIISVMQDCNVQTLNVSSPHGCQSVSQASSKARPYAH